MRILTVDDNQANLEFLEGALWIYSCPIDRAKNGLEALSMVNSNRYDLIITDINMPVMNGLEFYKELTLNAPDMKKKVIFTTSGLDACSERFIKQTRCSSLQKPLTLVELRKAVDEVMDGAKKGAKTLDGTIELDRG